MTTDRICPGCLKPLTSNTRQRLVCLTPDCRFTPLCPADGEAAMPKNPETGNDNPASCKAVSKYRADQHYAELFAQLRAKDALIGALLGSCQEVERILTFAFEEGALPEDQILGLCIDPWGVLNDLRTIIKAARAHTATAICRQHGASEVAVISDGPPSDTPLEQEER